MNGRDVSLLARAASASQPPFPALGPGRTPHNQLTDFVNRYGTSALYDALAAKQRMSDRNGS